MHRPAGTVREGDRVLEAGRPQPVIAVRHLAPLGAVRIITASGDALELAVTEPIDLIGGTP